MKKWLLFTTIVGFWTTMLPAEGIRFTPKSSSGGGVTLPLPGGGSNYIQNTDLLQPSTFYVSSGTISGNLIVLGSATVKGVYTSTGGMIVNRSSFTELNLSAGVLTRPTLYFRSDSRRTGFYGRATNVVGFTGSGANIFQLSGGGLSMDAGMTLTADNGGEGSPGFTFPSIIAAGLFTTASNFDLVIGNNSKGRIRVNNNGSIQLGNMKGSGEMTAGVNVTTITVNKPLFAVSSGNAGSPLLFEVAGTSASFAVNVNISSSTLILSSLTVRPGTEGLTGGVSAATYTVNGVNLFCSTWTTFGMDGSVIKVTTGTVAANTSITITAGNLLLTSIFWAMCSEVENVNTAVTSVRPKAFTALPASFDVYNADALNTKGFSCITVGKP